MNKFLLFLFGTAFTLTSYSQTGPNNPATAANVAGIGSIAWGTPTNVFSSNNAWSTCAAGGISNYLQATNFGFAIGSPSAIDGIVVDVERSTNGSSDVAILNAWSTGTTKTASAGSNRLLLVMYAQENGLGSRDLTALSYGGVAMTQVGESVAGTAGGFQGRIECWILNEAGIAAAGSTTLTPTFAAYTALDYCELYSSVVLRNVDQIAPVNSSQTSGASASTNPHQLSAAITTITGGMSINGVTCGNVGTYTINSGYTEGTDATFAAGTGAGARLQTASKATAASGTEQPACTFSAAVNRWMMIGLHVQRARELDNTVNIVKGGTITGTNLAATGTAWPTADAYTSYGSSVNLWGTTWTTADVNASNFGVALSTVVQNGTARVDHIRITVYSHSTLPIELLDFTATAKDSWVDLNWVTATETNNDYFLVQRSTDGITFEDIGQIPGAGNSSSTLFYELKDLHPLQGVSYYRLKQVDFDGAFDFSPIRVVNYNNSELLIFPNPTTDGNITIYNDNVEINSVSVYSSDLKLVKSFVLVDGVNPIVNIEDLADGAYFMLVKTSHKSEIVKVLKQTRD